MRRGKRRNKQGIPFPDNNEDDQKLADWLELSSILSKSRGASKSDLERRLNRSGLKTDNDVDAIENLCNNVFRELERRSTASEDSYPFVISNSSLILKGDVKNFIAYTFCLCLSFIGWYPKKNDKQNYKARRIFEDISCIAAKEFVNGESCRFAWPRNPIPIDFNFAVRSSEVKRIAADFGNAIHYVCLLIGEGTGYNGKETLSKKDDSLDVIAWRNFPDKKKSKLILFGQCASGYDWDCKINDLQPDHFLGYWTIDHKVSPIIRAFFIPHTIPGNIWDYHSMASGIFFDRCRISYYVHSKMKHIPNYCFIWCNKILNG